MAQARGSQAGLCGESFVQSIHSSIETVLTLITPSTSTKKALVLLRLTPPNKTCIDAVAPDPLSRTSVTRTGREELHNKSFEIYRRRLRYMGDEMRLRAFRHQIWSS